MCLYFVIMNGFARPEEVTEPALHISCEISILRIILSCHTMLEIIQVLDVQEMLGYTLGSIQVVQDAK